MEEKKGFVTIGYGKTNLETFIRILTKFKVNCIVDVRSSPYSSHSVQYKQFNRELLEASLAKHKISYNWMGDLLGGRPKDTSIYDEDGVVNYVKLAKSELFLGGIKTLESLSLENNVAIMCSEQDPMRCHRFMAISRELSKKNYRVVHILNMNEYIKHSSLEDKLVDIHFGNNVQLDLFTNKDNTLDQSYEKQNKLHAYRRK